MAKPWKVTIRGSYSDGTLAYPSVHMLTDVPTGGDEPTGSEIASGTWGVFGTEYKAICPTTFTIHEVVATECVLAPAIGDAGSHSVEQAGTLAGTDSAMPRSVVPLINLHTNVSSKSARGWIFLPGSGDTSKLTGRTWGTTMKTALDALAAKLDDSFDLGSLFITHVNPIVYSRTRHKAGLEPHTFKVTSATTSTKVHFLRSRDSNP